MKKKSVPSIVFQSLNKAVSSWKRQPTVIKNVFALDSYGVFVLPQAAGGKDLLGLHWLGYAISNMPAVLKLNVFSGGVSRSNLIWLPGTLILDYFYTSYKIVDFYKSYFTPFFVKIDKNLASFSAFKKLLDEGFKTQLLAIFINPTPGAAVYSFLFFRRSIFLSLFSVAVQNKDTVIKPVFQNINADN